MFVCCLFALLSILYKHNTKKNVVRVGPLWQNFLDPRMICFGSINNETGIIILNFEPHLSKEEGKDQKPKKPSTAPDPIHYVYGKVRNTQEKITHKRVKRSAFSQQVTTRLQGTSKTA